MICSIILSLQVKVSPNIRAEVLRDKTLRISASGAPKEWMELRLPHLLKGKTAELIRKEVERETKKYFEVNCPPANGWSRVTWKSVGTIEIYGSGRSRSGRFDMLGYLVYKSRASQVGVFTKKPFEATTWVVDWLKIFPKGIPASSVQ